MLNQLNDPLRFYVESERGECMHAGAAMYYVELCVSVRNCEYIFRITTALNRNYLPFVVAEPSM